jgi:hypothetical protein
MPQDLINLAFTLAAGGFGWWFKNMWDDHRALERKVSANEVEMARDYVRRDELTAILDRMDHKLDTISAKLDSKVDK